MGESFSSTDIEETVELPAKRGAVDRLADVVDPERRFYFQLQWRPVEAGSFRCWPRGVRLFGQIEECDGRLVHEGKTVGAIHHETGTFWLVSRVAVESAWHCKYRYLA